MLRIQMSRKVKRCMSQGMVEELGMEMYFFNSARYSLDDFRIDDFRMLAKL